jgi:hypothetical protein
MKIDKIDRWHQTKKGLITFGLVELAVAYLLTSKAIDNGSLIVYALAIIVFFGSLNNLIRFVKNRSIRWEK